MKTFVPTSVLLYRPRVNCPFHCIHHLHVRMYLPTFLKSPTCVAQAHILERPSRVYATRARLIPRITQSIHIKRCRDGVAYSEASQLRALRGEEIEVFGSKIPKPNVEWFQCPTCTVQDPTWIGSSSPLSSSEQRGVGVWVGCRYEFGW